MAQAAEYQPLVLVETADLSREEWLAYRRQGLGGSDAASVLGISPFRTAMDLYYDKRNLPIEDDEGNWVAMEVGTLLEDLVARIFAKKTGLKIYRRKCMFQHPAHPWMLADLDFLVEMPDGSTAILEYGDSPASVNIVPAVPAEPEAPAWDEPAETVPPAFEEEPHQQTEPETAPDALIQVNGAPDGEQTVPQGSAAAETSDDTIACPITAIWSTRNTTWYSRAATSTRTRTTPKLPVRS